VSVPAPQGQGPGAKGGRPQTAEEQLVLCHFHAECRLDRLHIHAHFAQGFFSFFLLDIAGLLECFFSARLLNMLNFREFLFTPSPSTILF